MKRMYLILLLAIFAMAFSTHAELEEDGLMSEEDSVYGEVESIDIGKNTITVIQYDYQKEEEVGVTYFLKDDLELEGLEETSEIRPGDWVDLEYYTDTEGRRIANFIEVEIEPDFEESREEEEANY